MANGRGVEDSCTSTVDVIASVKPAVAKARGICSSCPGSSEICNNTSILRAMPIVLQYVGTKLFIRFSMMQREVDIKLSKCTYHRKHSTSLAAHSIAFSLYMCQCALTFHYIHTVYVANKRITMLVFPMHSSGLP